MNKEVVVLIGNYGSGKSELALNMVMRTGKKATLVDLDIVNPYFRSSDLEPALKERGIRVIKPVYAGTGVEGLSLPPDIYSVFIDGSELVAFDVGGDATGATALGQYRLHFEKLQSLSVLFVVNPRRPLCATADETLELLELTSHRCRLSITGLVNNSNLSNESSAEDIMLGYEVVSEVSRRCGVPVKYTAGVTDVLTEFKRRAAQEHLDNKYIGEYIELNRVMRRDFERFTGDITVEASDIRSEK